MVLLNLCVFVVVFYICNTFTFEMQLSVLIAVCVWVVILSIVVGF